MSRNRKEKDEKEEKEPRLNVPSKRIKAAHRRAMKQENAEYIPLKAFVVRITDTTLKEVADAWILNKMGNK